MDNTRQFKLTAVNIHQDGIHTAHNEWRRGKNPGKKIPAIYARQSTEKQNTLDEQTTDCIEHARLNKNTKVLLFTDKGSAWQKNSEEKLYGIQQLMRCIVLGYIDTIIVYDISRLSRNMAMGIKLMNGIKTHNLKVHSLMNNTIYDNSPQSCDSFLEKILDAQKSSTLLSERLKTKFKHMRSKGHQFGAPRYGLMASKVGGIRKFITHPEEYKIVKQIKTKFTRRNHWDRSRNLKNIVSWLNEKGYTRRGYPWNTTKVWNIINYTFGMNELRDSLTS